MNKISAFMVASFAVVPAAHSLATTVDFEDLTLPSNSFYNGSDQAGGFTSRGAFFPNSFVDWGGGFTSWSGWSYSNVVDTTTPGFGNQYASYAGGGAGGSGNYAVGFGSTFINLPAGKVATSVMLTNTTYAALDMLHGSLFSKKFGGITGNDPDYFYVTLTGYSELGGGGTVTGSTVFYLADYRFADNAQDYIVVQWTPVDLTPLGEARSIGFSYTSSDVGPWGINTPTYVALDNLTLIPEPAGLALVGLGMMLLGGRRARR